MCSSPRLRRIIDVVVVCEADADGDAVESWWRAKEDGHIPYLTVLRAWTEGVHPTARSR